MCASYDGYVYICFCGTDECIGVRFMKAYVVAITFSIILCAAADMIVPSQKYRGIIRIACGLFVIGTIVSPIKDLIGFEYSSFDSNVFLAGKDEFFFKVEQGKQNYKEYLEENGNGIVQDEISKELSSVFGQNVTVKIAGEGLVLSDAEVSKREEITEYIKKQYALDVTYED